MGTVGESIAAWWLRSRGLRVVARNVEVGTGEIDLLVTDGYRRVAVEVRTITGSGDPIDAVDSAKRDRVRRLAAIQGAGRVDLIGVGLRSDHVEIHWVPG